MQEVNWQGILGWSPDQIEEIRFAGFSYLKEGRYEKALLFFKALVILDPKNAYDAQTLGALYLQIGEVDDALTTLDQALALLPNHEPTILNKAKALFMTTKKKEALDIVFRLQRSADPQIAGDAGALYDAYT